MSPKGRFKASDDRRRQILDAALELFLEVGVGDCRVDDLLARADVSVGSLYHHFGNKPGVAAALHLEILERYQADFLSELQAHRSARAGVRAIVGHHLAWVANDPQRAAFLFQCLEPEVLAVCSEDENRMTTAFFSTCAAWVEERTAVGHLRRLSFLECYVLWMGPTLELARGWLMNVQKKWTWMSPEQCRPETLLGAEKTLADAAWRAIGGRRSGRGPHGP